MAKSEAVYNAVISTLEEHSKPTDRPDYVMGDPPYRYDDVTIDNFLDGVREKLAGGNPAYAFAYDEQFRTKALKQDVADLIAEIESNTKP